MATKKTAKKTYEVSIPTAGVVHITVTVAADADADDIFDAAVNEYCKDEENGEHEWEFHQRICEGNVLYAEQNEWDYTEVED